KSMRIEYRLHNNINYARADAAKEVINIESTLSPRALDVASKHPQHKHVDQDVPEAFVQKKIGKWLPDPEGVRNAVRHQTKKQFDVVIFGRGSGKLPHQELHQK